ncbi:hypothetical protein D3C85_1865430 [compost metagenome]
MRLYWVDLVGLVRLSIHCGQFSKLAVRGLQIDYFFNEEMFIIENRSEGLKMMHI